MMLEMVEMVEVAPREGNLLCVFTFSLGIFFFAQPSQIIGYLGQISSCA